MESAPDFPAPIPQLGAVHQQHFRITVACPGDCEESRLVIAGVLARWRGTSPGPGLVPDYPSQFAGARQLTMRVIGSRDPDVDTVAITKRFPSPDTAYWFRNSLVTPTIPVRNRDVGEPRMMSAADDLTSTDIRF